MNAEALDLFAVRAARDKYQLRDYQAEAVARVRAELAERRSTLLVMATGLGKTVTLGALVREWRGRVLVLAHRDELLAQAREKLEEMTGERVDVEQAAWRASGARIVVGSVATLARTRRTTRVEADGREVEVLERKRLERFARAPFSLIVIDEAHHAAARSYRNILAAFPEAKVLGVTATPDRGDGRALGMVFESVAYRMDIDVGIESGYLCPVRVCRVHVDEVSIAHVRTTAGDLAAGELDAAMAEAVAPIARAAIEHCGSRRTVIFAPGVRTAHALAETLNRLREGSARAIDGEMDRVLRRHLLREHRRGSYQYIVNCAILTEGYDDPGVDAIVMARPTKSRALYAQMAGRGLRIVGGIDRLSTADERVAAIAASVKPDCLILDIAGNSGRHALIGPEDLLGGRYTDDERERAKQIAREEPGVRTDAALERARREIEERKRAAAAAAARARVTVRVEEVSDPFRVLGVRKPWLRLPRAQDLATPRQRWKLQQLGIPIPEGCTWRQASRLIGADIARAEKGLCTYRQIMWLAKFGIDGRRMTAATGKRIAEALKANGFQRLSAEQLDAAIAKPEPGADG